MKKVKMMGGSIHSNSAYQAELEARVQKLEEQLEDVMGQAYQVIGGILHHADMFNHPAAESVLDYFSLNKYREDFLPVDFSPRDIS